MNPEQSQPISPESAGQNYSPEFDISINIEQDTERKNESTELRPVGNSGDTLRKTSLPPVVNNSTNDNSVITNDQVVVKNTNPSTAKDGENIEKEWVNKAKNIISETHDDPYDREEQIKELKADYLFKRYGRKLGDRN